MPLQFRWTGGANGHDWPWEDAPKSDDGVYRFYISDSEVGGDLELRISDEWQEVSREGSR